MRLRSSGCTAIIHVSMCISLLALLSACGGGGGLPDVETVYVNGHVVTMDEAQPEAGAFAVGGGMFVAVGTTDEIRSAYPDADVVDLGGRTVMPGIIESHGHLLNLGRSFMRLNVMGVETPEEAVDMVRARVAETPPGEWITGWGWDDGAWAQNYPGNEALSRVSPDNPVFLSGLHGFAGWANKKALEISGITTETPNPPNGEILKDPRTGRPTGILTNRAQDILSRQIPELTHEQMERAFTLAFDECLRYGLTSVHDAHIFTDDLKALRTMKAKNMLKIRLYTMIACTDEELLGSFLESGPEIDPDNLLTNRCIKVFVDGALGSRGALMAEPYSDAPDVTGVTTTPEDALYDLSVRALESGMQIAVHAIGDRANRLTLDAFERAFKQVPSATGHRFRIEHAQVMGKGDIERFEPMGIIASMSPPHATSDMLWAETRVGPERITRAYAWRSFLDTGVHLALNSDFPGETLDPFYGMYAAETRQSPDGQPPGGWYPEQCLTRDEALRGYTVEGAYAGFEEDIKGRIRTGMLADFVVLSDDILAVPSRGLLNMKALQTYVGGRLVYDAESAR